MSEPTRRLRVAYLSDLHLEAQVPPGLPPPADVMILAGDICHASCLDPTRHDRYNTEQRARVLGWFEALAERCGQIIWIAGNHEHHDGRWQETHDLMRRVPGPVHVLDGGCVEVMGLRVFGATLWTDMGGGDPTVIAAVRRRMGDYFFIQTESADGGLRKFQPADAAAACARDLAALSREIVRPDPRPLLVVTHHAPSRLGCASRHDLSDPLTHVYASDLDQVVAASGAVGWVHGHTHVAKRYTIGGVPVVSNAYGFAARGPGPSQGFSLAAALDVDVSTAPEVRWAS